MILFIMKDRGVGDGNNRNKKTSIKFRIISGCLISSRPQRRAAGARLYVVCTLMSITFRGERSALLPRNPQHMIFISASYKMSPRTTKSSLANNKKEVRPNAFFSLHVAPKQMQIPASTWKAACRT